MLNNVHLYKYFISANTKLQNHRWSPSTKIWIELMNIPIANVSKQYNESLSHLTSYYNTARIFSVWVLYHFLTQDWLSFSWQIRFGLDHFLSYFASLVMFCTIVHLRVIIYLGKDLAAKLRPQFQQHLVHLACHNLDRKACCLYVDIWPLHPESDFYISYDASIQIITFLNDQRKQTNKVIKVSDLLTTQTNVYKQKLLFC